MNSDLTLVPLEKKGGSVLFLMGFITPVVHFDKLSDYGAGKRKESNQTTFQHSQECENVPKPARRMAGLGES